jgi:methylphosphotriester-DNA--protein-cysteine methyltransferase
MAGKTTTKKAKVMPDLEGRIKKLEGAEKVGGIGRLAVARAQELVEKESAKVLQLAYYYVRRTRKAEIGLTAKQTETYKQLLEIDADTAEKWKAKRIAERKASARK